MNSNSDLMPTYLGNVINATGTDSIYDENVKLILADKSVLAWILRRCTNEFAEKSLATVQACINGDPVIGKMAVTPHLTNKQKQHSDKLESLSQEDTSPTEGSITYDVRFKVNIPQSAPESESLEDTCLEMIINVEAQKDYYPGYPIVSRGIFYASRMISAQLDKDFTAPNYGEIKKVYSIWICFQPPQYMMDKVISYQIHPRMLHGDEPDRLRGYDLMRVVIIGLINDLDHHCSADQTIRMLSTLFSVTLSAQEKKQRLQDEFQFQMTREIEERSAQMCNVSSILIEKGIEQEKKNSLLTAAELSKEYGVSLETALSSLKARNEWSATEVDHIVRMVYSK